MLEKENTYHPKGIYISVFASLYRIIVYYKFWCLERIQMGSEFKILKPYHPPKSPSAPAGGCGEFNTIA
jgi:hypothetical protein